MIVITVLQDIFDVVSVEKCEQLFVIIEEISIKVCNELYVINVDL